MTDFPVPTGREEAWRFTPTRRLRGLFEPLADGGDGKLLVEADLPEGITLDHVDPRADARVGSVFAPTERVAALAFEGVKQAAVVSVPANARPDKPVSLVGAPGACKLDVVPPREMTWAEGKALSDIPADQPNTLMAWGAQFANKILVNCP